MIWIKSAIVALVVTVTILGGALTAQWVGKRIVPTATTTTQFVLTTIPRSPTTTTTSVVLQTIPFVRFVKKPYEDLDQEKLCTLANVSPSGEALVATLYIWMGENLEGAELDLVYDRTSRLLFDMIRDKPCGERANQILDESVPFMTGGEG